MEEEVHPFIHLGEAIPGNKMVVGTFPVYTLTSPETAHKLAVRHANDVHIFYGSHHSQFRSYLSFFYHRKLYGRTWFTNLSCAL